MYRGTIPHGDDSELILLELVRSVATGEPSFTLDEIIRKPGKPDLGKKTVGNWYISSGRLDDEEAQVLELRSRDEIMFFLQINDSMLQKIDGTQHDIEPVSRYMIRKTKIVPSVRHDTISEHDKTMQRLSGTYKGKLSCADCNSILSSLTLQYKVHSKTGDYTLTDKYLGTKSGDATNERKGKWNYQSQLIEADHKSNVIVLDPDKPGHEAYYLTKKDGSIIQVDKSLKRSITPQEQSLKRQ